MYALCRVFGHKVSRHRMQRDPITFDEHTVCKRCGVELVRSRDHGWAEEQMPDPAAL